MVIRQDTSNKPGLSGLTSSALLALSVLAVAAPQARAQQNDSAIALEAAYSSEFWKNTQGGLDSGSAWLDNLDLTLEAGLGNGTLFVYGLYNNNSSLTSDIVGDLQTVSNIDNTRLLRLHELWYRHEFSEGRLALKFGLSDLNADFNSIDTANWFINSSHGIDPSFSQTGENGPSIFPSTSLALSGEYHFSDSLVFRVGIFDAIPNDPERPEKFDPSLEGGALTVTELTYITEGGTRWGLGLWSYSADFPQLLPSPDNTASERNQGYYGFFDTILIDAGSEGPLLRGWLRYGHANAALNYLDNSVSTGLVLENFQHGRRNDVIGFGLASADIGDSARRMHIAEGEEVASREVNLELFYQFRVTQWFSLTPDLQYVINPGIAGNLDNALVLGLRFEFLRSGGLFGL